ncbi:MAG: class B sortase [Christensenellales bacterium]
MMQGGGWNGRRPRRVRYSRFRRGRLALLAASVALVLFGLTKLIGYGRDLAASRRAAEALRQVYHAPTPVAPVETDAPTTLPVTAAPAMTVAQATPTPTFAPALRLRAMAYPGNPKLRVSSRFRALRRENRDIIGWLTIGKMLDEAVVQRDSEYYMTHDARGDKNVNGALFLDAAITLQTRPHTLMIYGHNMKSGAMFGCLRNYDSISFYRNSPFLSFDSLYEQGRYVIFAAGTVSTEESRGHYLDFYALGSDNVRERQRAIDALIATSVHTCPIDVRPEDQLLVLVTCVERDDERRVVAARRIRDGEDEARLKELAGRSRKR